ncbi:hypothetical protein B0H17DRAFT_1195844 [Mycena rosella]|uniref:Uncharacterized protein n=1 Tax=Mycena rosella TaxID=1033263 RepID=A0AAD7DW29_MYCRO|nr:hypothetical protein B0H17DRAFT_1195844 [Mycena rosella]
MDNEHSSPVYKYLQHSLSNPSPLSSHNHPTCAYPSMTHFIVTFLDSMRLYTLFPRGSDCRRSAPPPVRPILSSISAFLRPPARPACVPRLGCSSFCNVLHLICAVVPSPLQSRLVHRCASDPPGSTLVLFYVAPATAAALAALPPSRPCRPPALAALPPALAALPPAQTLLHPLWGLKHVSRARNPYIDDRAQDASDDEPSDAPPPFHRQRTPLFLPGSRGPTLYSGPGDFSCASTSVPADAFAAPPSFQDARQHTPLFLLGSRGPMPYSGPSDFSRASTSTPAEARESPPRPVPPGVAQFLDLHASDSDDDDNAEVPFIMTQQDLDFIDDDTAYPESMPPLPKHNLEHRELSDLAERAAHYKRQSASYRQSTAMELDDSVELSEAVQDLAQHPGLRPAIEEAITFVMPKPAASAVPPLPSQVHETETAGQMLHRLKQLVPPASSSDVVQNGTWIRYRYKKAAPQLAFAFSLQRVLVQLPPETGDALLPRRDDESSDNADNAEVDVVGRLSDTRPRFQAIVPRKPLRQAAYPRVYPTIEEVAPFFGVYEQFGNARFVGPAFSLQAGDRVIVSEGQRAGDHFYILKVHDFLADTTNKDRYIPLERVPKETAVDQNLVVRMAKLHMRAEPTKENPGFWHPLHQLRRHVLYPSALPQILDRVQITGLHPSLDQGVAWIMDVQDIGDHRQRVKVQRQNETLDVELDRLRRDFRLGDQLLVARSEHKLRKGFVTALLDCGVLELFDGSQPEWSQWTDAHPDTDSGGEFGMAHTFQVRSADVDFRPFNDDGNDSAMFAVHEFAGQYTARSEVTHLSIPRPPNKAPSILLTKAEDASAIWADKDARAVASDFAGYGLAGKFKQLDEEQSQRLLQIASFQQNDKAKLELVYKVGHRFEGLDVVVVGARIMNPTIENRKGSVFKGKRGRVIGDYDTAKRVARLRAQDLALRKNLRADTCGIMVSIRGADNRVFQIEVDKLIHAGTRLPLAQAVYLPNSLLKRTPEMASEKTSTKRLRTPSPEPLASSDSAWGSPLVAWQPVVVLSLAGEDTGAWLCTAAVVRKHVNVEILGVSALPRKNKMKTSDSLRELEGKRGIMLLGEQVAEKELDKSKINLYRVGGATGLPRKIPGKCIKLLRVGDDGRSIVEVAQRILVLGPDVEGDKWKVGRYAETDLLMLHTHGDGVVGVRFYPERVGNAVETGFYHVLQLCRSTNQDIDSPDHPFPRSAF